MLWLKRIGLLWLALVALAILVSFTGYLYLRQSLPQLAGESQLSGLYEPIEVVRDKSAVLHIYSQSWNDAYFVLGFVHAQGRLWQMEMNRRIAAGRLAELLGDVALETDKFFSDSRHSPGCTGQPESFR